MKQASAKAAVQPQPGSSSEGGAFFSAGIDPTELERILARIDENLAFRQTLRRRSVVADLPELGGFDRQMQVLQTSPAPLFAPGQRGVSGLIRGLLNLPIRVFGRRQVAFNDVLRSLFLEVGVFLHALEQRKADSDQSETLSQLEDNIRTMQDQFRGYSQETGDALQSVKQSIEEHRGLPEQQLRAVQDAIQDSKIQTRGMDEWLKALARGQEGTEAWIRLIQADVRDTALEVRTLRADQIRPETAPRFVSPGRAAAAIAAMGDDIKLNLGCGHKPLPGYLNIDSRVLPEADMVSEVRSLPFELGTIAEIASFHLVEHFPEHELKTRILPHWHELLRPGGVLRVVCPNWAAMIDQLNSGRMNIERFKLLTFGGQDYNGDDHSAMYTPETLTQVIVAAGFGNPQVVVSARDNGGCPEMELVARKEAS